MQKYVENMINHSNLLNMYTFLGEDLRGLTLLRKNKLSKEITNKTEPIVPIVFGSILR